ncbi:DNA-directed RNA polymerase subunit beta [Virgibacillus sp. AGTR]|uniref:DNA-directed RNA polymerase subunit beta n=1 Tax=Virgibacillus TaxID=84406 RepID=UPI00041AFA56|nr:MULTISPECIES: DNA-directed RNA polymerase subunit beta [Bacillaceae]MCC2252309.1 DNA-directed RNA polymerase subunit beta [Virgibacillus sp. AGTR]QRZ18499.1 DNA-directed RNA polymerase subunit beta [Virgibacillus sp. AGTR]WBX81903.1 DNA-directed RNA polymerase subunit beta [Virgibacillus salarius]
MSINQEDRAMSEKKPKRPSKFQRFLNRMKEKKDRPVEAEGKTRKSQKQKQKQERKMGKRPRLRIFPIWLRIIVVLLFCAIALVAGLMIGYGVIGDGTPVDVLKKETWQHIIDIVTKTE